MSSFIQVLSLYSDGRYDENFLGNYAILHIKDRLARINGVGSVQVMAEAPMRCASGSSPTEWTIWE